MRRKPQSTLSKNIQRASIYLRWLACSVLIEDYEELEKRSDKPYPGATVFSYMWTAVEGFRVGILVQLLAPGDDPPICRSILMGCGSMNTLLVMLRA